MIIRVSHSFYLIIIILFTALTHQQTITDDGGMFFSITKETIQDLFQRNAQLQTSDYLRRYYNSSSSSIKEEVEANTNTIKEAFEYLIAFSSRTRNDLSNYYECIKTNASNKNKYTYFIIQFDSKDKSLFYYPKTITFGLCMVYDTSLYDNDSSTYTNDIKTLIALTNEESRYAIIPEGISFSITNVIEFQNSKNEWYELLALCIGLFISTVLFLSTLFNIIPECLFKCCLTKHKNYSIISKEDQNKSKLFRFVSCFNLTENSEELFGNNLNTVIYNNTGLSYAKGVNSICLLLFLFGLTYMRLFQSSTLMFQENKYFNTVRSPIFPLFSFGVRYCPRIIFSISGFTFIYKILCFFEEESSMNQEVNEELCSQLDGTSLNDNNNGDGNDKLNNSLDILIKQGILLDKKEYNPNKIAITSLLVFIMKQSHKFVNGLATVLIFRTISIIIKSLSIFCASLAIVYKEILGKFRFEDIFGHFFLYKTFNLFDGSLSQDKHDYCCMRFIWIFINEVFFFIITSPIIFLCCKCKLSLNKVILTLLALFLIMRYLIYYLMLRPNNTYDRATNILSDDSSFNSFAMNPLYNYSDFLIGVFFGLMNYVLQKDISDVNQPNNSIFGLSTTIVYYFKNQSKILLYFFIAIDVGLVCSIVGIQELFYLSVSDDDEAFYYNEGINGFYLIDIEVVIVLIHLFLFSLYAKGGNCITQILSSRAWIKFNKLSFSVTTSINMYLLLILHQSETMISLEMFSFFFYGIITFATMLLYGFFNCIINEFPMKRIIKLTIKEVRKSKKN